MVLEQDAAQASEAAAILAEQQYQKELAQYNKDKAVYDKEKAEYDAQQKKIDDAKAKEEARIAEEKRLAKEKADKRAAEFAAVEKEYQETLAKNPYTGENRKIESAKRQGRHFNRLKFNYEWGQQSQNYDKNAKEAKREAEREVRTKHLTQDGWTPTPIPVTGWLQPDAAKQLGDIAQGKGRGYRNVDANSAYQVSVVLANRAVQYGEISISQHSSQIAAATAKYRGYKERQSAEFSRQARAKSAGQLAADRAHWQSVVNDPNTSGKNQASINAMGLSHNVQQLDDAGLSTIYNVGDSITKGGSLPSSATVTINNQSYIIPTKPNQPTIPTRTNTSGNKGVNEANQIQKQYVQDLREGKVGLAQALLQPQTPQRYSQGNTVNLKQYLTERGYNINRPETIPDSVLTTPVKYDAARKQASKAEAVSRTAGRKYDMGDLRNIIPSQPRVSDAVLQQRQKAMENIAASKGGSYIGYGPDGTPIQGAPFVKQQFQVTTKDGTVRTFNSLEHAEKFSQRISKDQWTVTYDSPTKVPTMSGGVIIPLQETKTFDSKEEADSFIKTLEGKNIQKIKSDNEFVNALRYADLVDSGEVQHPRETPSLADDVLYYSSAGLRPIYNLPLAGYNLTQEKPTPIEPTTFESLVGGLMESGQHALTGGEQGRPIQQTMGETWKHFTDDPVRSIVEIPAEVGISLVGGKAIQGAVKTGGVVKSGIASKSKTMKTAIKTVDEKIVTVKGIPSTISGKVGIAAEKYAAPNKMYSPLTPGQKIVQSLININKKVNYVEAKKVGVTTKLYYTVSPSGRKSLSDAKSIGQVIEIDKERILVDVPGKKFTQVEFDTNPVKPTKTNPTKETGTKNDSIIMTPELQQMITKRATIKAQIKKIKMKQKAKQDKLELRDKKNITKLEKKNRVSNWDVHIIKQYDKIRPSLKDKIKTRYTETGMTAKIKHPFKKSWYTSKIPNTPKSPVFNLKNYFERIKYSRIGTPSTKNPTQQIRVFTEFENDAGKVMFTDKVTNVGIIPDELHQLKRVSLRETTTDVPYKTSRTGELEKTKKVIPIGNEKKTFKGKTYKETTTNIAQFDKQKRLMDKAIQENIITPVGAETKLVTKTQVDDFFSNPQKEITKSESKSREGFGMTEIEKRTITVSNQLTPTVDTVSFKQTIIDLNKIKAVGIPPKKPITSTGVNFRGVGSVDTRPSSGVPTPRPSGDAPYKPKYSPTSDRPSTILTSQDKTKGITAVIQQSRSETVKTTPRRYIPISSPDETVYTQETHIAVKSPFEPPSPRVIHSRPTPTREMTGLRSNVIPIIKSDTIQSISPITTIREAIDTKQTINTKQDTVQSLKTQTELKTRAQTKSKTTQKSKQITRSQLKLVVPTKLTTPNQNRVRTKIVPIIIITPKIQEKRRKTRQPRKQKDFLGNTRTDHIVGLFKRTEIITGDKKVAKQIKKDKKYKEGKKKKKVKKKTNSFLQKQGVLNKGFKF